MSVMQSGRRCRQHSGPVSAKLQRDVVDLKALVHELPVGLRERVAERLRSLENEVERVAGLEAATMGGRS